MSSFASNAALAAVLGVDRYTINDIRLGKTWSHLKENCMHPVADKIKMSAFEGQVEILGKTRFVTFSSAFTNEDGKEVEPAVLTVHGLSMAETWDVLSRLHGPVGVASTNTNGAKPVEPTPKPVEVKKAEAPKPPAPAPKPEPTKAAPTVKAEPEDDDLDDGGAKPDLDMEFLSKQDKLRAVLEHMISRGIKTADELTKACMSIKDRVPCLIAIEAKGGTGLERRVERSAMIVLTGDDKSS